jgi:glycosyltransferase involved in cell wall biosynthesis
VGRQYPATYKIRDCNGTERKTVSQSYNKLPVTALVPTKNEAVNLRHCLDALEPAEKVFVLDSHSTDDTVVIAEDAGAAVVQFDYFGGYPKKRQWALDNLPIDTPWILLVDADEMITPELWDEINGVINGPQPRPAYFITKKFNFLGRSFNFGGVSFSAIVLFQRGKTRFEEIMEDDPSGMDMEVHERVLVDGQVGKLNNPLIHRDFKSLESYIDRHNKYSSWEAKLRHRYLETGQYGGQTINARFFGNAQEQRRFLKKLAIRIPFEPFFWFVYHYVLRLGFLEGRPGLIASSIRANYISQVRAKIYELQLNEKMKP